MWAPGVVHHGTRRRRAAYRRVVWSGAEVLVTVGVVLLLLVAHQLWWTNRQARQGAEHKVQALEREWGTAGTPGAAGAAPGGDDSGSGSASGSGAGTGDGGQDGKNGAGASTGTASSRGASSDSARTTPRWSQAYAVLGIPRLSLRVPVAEGVSKADVLNKGYVGHYKGTQQPGQAGNFALAGHRNTHGEPFRYLPRLRRGDTITVETKSAVYTYVVDRTLPQTSPSDGGVIRPVPRSIVRPSYGYSEPGYYITLTTCTPDYTSRYRMAVWGKLTAMRPR
ncbi:class E sortase [Streptomyces sp. NBC_00198]|uniref:class E sortase n=1 Tax=Streptomyces sp. NBC_00198 TaxID=2975677 RepID=UPI00224FD921|nr:class E sortase [Streptomyces sp. NBC_00198]MCX5283556.1 class E sortase [Streptomyces sp. NBC_00198]